MKLPQNEYYFTFEGTDIDGKKVVVDSRYLLLGMKEKPEELFTIMKSEALDINTMDSVLYTDTNTFENVEMELEFYILSEKYEAVKNAMINMIKCNKGKISFGWDNEYYYNCRLATNLSMKEFDITGEYWGELILALELEPYKYVKGGDEFVADNLGRTDLKHGSKIMNFYDTSYPLIYLTVPNGQYLDNFEGKKVFGISFSVLDDHGNETDIQTMIIKGLTGSMTNRRICIDTKNQYTYAVDGNYGENMNNLIDINSEYINLKPGNIMISFSHNFIKANAYEVNIIPNWRSL